jgi:hypothetical protein
MHSGLDDSTETYFDFLRGFQRGMALPTLQEADAQWAAYSRQLSQTERLRDEAGGYSRGQVLGFEAATLYSIKISGVL